MSGSRPTSSTPPQVGPLKSGSVFEQTLLASLERIAVALEAQVHVSRALLEVNAQMLDELLGEGDGELPSADTYLNGSPRHDG